MSNRQNRANVTGWLIVSVLAVLPVFGALLYSMTVKDQQTVFNNRTPTKSSDGVR